jgi:ABC-2 type transport system permease protein
MNIRRVSALAQRVMRQILRDVRTVTLLIVAPMLLLSLGAVLFRSDPPRLSLGIVNEDAGVPLPSVGTLVLGDRIVRRLADSDAFDLVSLQPEEIDARLRDGTVEGVLILAADLSATFQRERQVTLDLRLEGSNPTRSTTVTARVTEAAMKALAGLAATSPDLPVAAGDAAELPVAVETSYLYAGDEFDGLDFVAPVYIAFLALFFVFLLTCVSFIRERSQGTFERLLATPATRLEIVLGYMVGLGLFALLQVAVILLFTVWVIQISYLGHLGLLFLIVALLAVVGVNLGILASAFARTEFQVVQFIPLLIIPQALLGDVFWAIEDLPAHLQPLARIMPITYANRALRAVMLKGWGLAEIWHDLAVLAGIAVLLLALGALTMRREV